MRLEFPGAYHHVLNRGNDRAQVFATEQTRAAYEPVSHHTGKLRRGHLPTAEKFLKRLQPLNVKT